MAGERSVKAATEHRLDGGQLAELPAVRDFGT